MGENGSVMYLLMLRSHCICDMRSAMCDVSFGAIVGKKMNFFKVFTRSHHVSPMPPRGCSEVVISLRGVVISLAIITRPVICKWARQRSKTRRKESLAASDSLRQLPMIAESCQSHSCRICLTVDAESSAQYPAVIGPISVQSRRQCRVIFQSRRWPGVIGANDLRINHPKKSVGR